MNNLLYKLKMRLFPVSPFNNVHTPGLRLSRWISALMIAIASDTASFIISLTFFLQLGVDILTAVLLIAVFGWSPGLFVVLIFEAIPVLSMFPAWTLLIIAMMISGRHNRNHKAQNKELYK